MTQRILVVLIAMIAAAPTLTAHARGSLSLQCFGDVALDADLDLALMTEKETTSSTKLYSATTAVTTTSTTPDELSFQCSFIVPADYDTTGDPPELNFYGWVPPGQPAGVAGCTLPNDVVWDFKERVMSDGDATGTAETGSQTTNTAQLTCESCASAYCFEDEVLYEFSGEVTQSATDWSVGDLIVVRVLRESNSEDYTGDFWVWLNGIELDYPN